MWINLKTWNVIKMFYADLPHTCSSS